MDELAAARIGRTFNQYAEGPRAGLLRGRLAAYLESRAGARILLVGEAPGYRGARVSGIPFTSERQLTGCGPAEATATIVHRVLRELAIEDDVLLWNVVPTHPGTATSNRRPTNAEIAAGLRFVRALAEGRRVVAVGRVAERALGVHGVRHPSHGGAESFRIGLGWMTPCGCHRALSWSLRTIGPHRREEVRDVVRGDRHPQARLPSGGARSGQRRGGRQAPLGRPRESRALGGGVAGSRGSGGDRGHDGLALGLARACFLRLRRPPRRAGAGAGPAGQAAEREDRSTRRALAGAVVGEGHAAGVVDPARGDPAAPRPHPAAQDAGRGPASLGAAAARVSTARGLAVCEVAAAVAVGHALGGCAEAARARAAPGRLP